MPLGRVVATRLAQRLQIPLETLLLATWTEAAAQPAPPPKRSA